MNQSKEMALLAYNALEDKKSEDIRVIEIGNISVIADYFIIANGNSSSQVSAMVDAVEEALSKKGYEPKRIEGVHSSGWILIYDLERIWRDGKTVSLDELNK